MRDKDIDEGYDFIRKYVADYEKKATDMRAARNKTIPQCLRAYRAKHGMTKEGLARALGVARMQVYRWEREPNPSVPCDEVMRKLEEMKIVDEVK